MRFKGSANNKRVWVRRNFVGIKRWCCKEGLKCNKLLRFKILCVIQLLSIIFDKKRPNKKWPKNLAKKINRVEIHCKFLSDC